MRKINLEKATKITNMDIWLKVAPPKGGEAQWKDGYSAKELARFVIEHPEVFSKLLDEVVKSTVGYRPSSFTGEPEATTNLPPQGSSGPREHDLLLYDNRIVIGIEAKVNEPFGNDKSIRQEKESTSKYERINWLIKTILQSRQIDEKEVGDLKYQLFAATAGTLLEAAKRDLEECIFLVLAFHPKDGPVNQANKKSFEDFVSVVCGENKDDSKQFTVEYKDGKKEIKKEVKCWFIERDIAFTQQKFYIDDSET